MHDDHPPNKPAGQLATAPRIRRLRLPAGPGPLVPLDSSAYTEIKVLIPRHPVPVIRLDSSAYTEIKGSFLMAVFTVD